ncbi:DUF2796 domain-containing protein [Noviherbaspirillum sp. Root189]|uniref:DUF2796 domain-containing protein n=1 Tax=Noviherbaspirillum sp. Root189 TaxID=1736487 RepID=UPI00070D1009|nr:DUF2796 domain-containing protein [Noviherbaspirillum sp. Root189]KRB67869.1 hypothetical protein ASE07_09390 [Noviherbaspirillum sp. Root189]
MLKRYALFALLCVTGSAIAGEVHQHGVAQMTAAIEGNTATIEFTSPLENLIGFEHAPRNDKEHKMVQALKEKFHKPESLLTPTAAADCRADPVDLELPGDHESDGHAELHATIMYRCKSPAALKEINLRLFDVFPGLGRVKVQLAAPGRQSAVELSRKRPSLSW